MVLTPIWRTRLFAAGGALLAVVFGTQIANEAFFWPGLVIAALLGIIVLYVQPQPVLAILLGALLLGYIVGNRGFAQLSLLGSFPLLPGEFVLLVGCVILLTQSAWRHELPIGRDLLNSLLLLWIALGSVRLLFCIREYGVAAIRDFALVYYAVFFFLAQHVAREASSAEFLQRSVRIACGVLLIVHPIFSNFPEFFFNTLSIRGVPLIFFKDDLAGNFLAMGAVLFFLHYERTRQLRWAWMSLALAGWMLTTDSRSSIVGLIVGAAWLAASGRWRLTGMLAVTGVFAAVVILLASELQHRSWRETPLHRIYARVMSIADPLGQGDYQTEDAFKRDNNVFRIVWWRASVAEAFETNRWFGLGFGHDLAARFVREYFPEESDEFTARSPHNVLITIFARMGLVGFAVFLAIIAVCAVSTWRALHDPELVYTSGAAWCAAWVVLVCACFGVVLEGPMGAVVFWILLGLANSYTPAPKATVPAVEESGVEALPEREEIGAPAHG